MSNNTPYLLQTEISESASNLGREGISDSVWSRILEAGQAASVAVTSSDNFLSSPPLLSTGLARHSATPVPALAAVTGRLESGRASGMDSNDNVDVTDAAGPEVLVNGSARVAITDSEHIVGETNRPATEDTAAGHFSSFSHEDTRDPSAETARVTHRRVGTESRLQAQGSASQTTQPTNEMENELLTRQQQIDEMMRLSEESMTIAALARATMPSRRPITVSTRANETGEESATRYEREETLEFIRRQEQFRERTRQITEWRRQGSTDRETNSGSATRMPTSPSLAPNTSIDADGSVERSTSTRRDLDRALRDYRLARRALRTHYGNEPSSPGDQNTPSYQGVMAQIAEQQNNNRNRMRARGQSRSNTLERVDAIVDRIVTTTDQGNHARTRNEGGETAAGRATASSFQQSDGVNQRSSRTSADTAPVGTSIPFEPYLGPTSNGRGSNSMPGGMRDFYRRIEDHDRNSPRPAVPASRFGTLRLNATTEQPSNSANNQTRNEVNREQRLNETLDRFANSLAQLQARTGKPSYTTSKARAKRILRHLSELKTLDRASAGSSELAKELSINFDIGSLAETAKIDLATHVEELPKPQYSSWFEVGMRWEGLQKGLLGKSETRPDIASSVLATGPLFEPSRSTEDRLLHLRALRHRERVRAERREGEQAQGTSDDPSWLREESQGLLRGYSSRMETLADLERHLTDLLADEERRLSRGGTDEWRVSSVSFEPRATSTSTLDRKEELGDQWPVKVTLHEVNLQTMTLSGTMIASRMSQRSDPAAHHDGDTDGAGVMQKDGGGECGMETFFDGEIIDFNSHELETVSDKPGYNVGGLVTDLKYWSRIGPFKKEVEKNIAIACENKANETYERLGITGTLEEQREKYQCRYPTEQTSAGELDKEEAGIVVYDTMAACLGSCEWINKSLNEEGWVLMRWKERCFIDPSTSAPSSSSPSMTTPEVRTLPRARDFYGISYDTVLSHAANYLSDHRRARTAWGLTIRGFYYVALHRLSGKIEALYYDSGSQPYQELTCKPVGRQSSLEDLLEENDSDKSLAISDVGEIGIRRDFGTYEFR